MSRTEREMLALIAGDLVAWSDIVQAFEGSLQVCGERRTEYGCILPLDTAIWVSALAALAQGRCMI
jgi:hypothetical protein